MCCGDLVSAELGCQNGCADIFKQTSLRDDVAHVRNVMQDHGVRREQRRCHTWQRRVFGTANRNSAVKWPATRDTKLVHDAGQSNENQVRTLLEKTLATDLHETNPDFVSV
jgi:hypothetical protein